MRLVVVLFTIVVMFSTVVAQDVEQIIGKTLDHYQGMESFYAEFEQQQCDEVRGVCCSYTGKIYFVKPNFFRMEMDEPKQIYVGDSISLWIYIPEEKHAIRQKLEEVPFQVNPDYFLQNYQDRFTAELAGESEHIYVILLLPKKETDIYDHITISITKKDYKIAGISIYDQAGSENTFIFTKTKINKKISKKKFKFEPPEGTKIDEY